MCVCVIHLGRLLVTQPVVPHYGASSELIITDLRVGLRPHTQHTRDNEVTTPRFTSRTYSLLGEQELHVKGDTLKLSPSGLGIEPRTSGL